MKTPIYRPLSFEERFFKQPIVVNVPYSVLPANLPKISTAPVNTSPPIPDLTLSHPTNKGIFSLIGSFVTKNQEPIFWGVVVGLLTLLYKAYKKKETKECTTSKTEF